MSYRESMFVNPGWNSDCLSVLLEERNWGISVCNSRVILDRRNRRPPAVETQEFYIIPAWYHIPTRQIDRWIAYKRSLRRISEHLQLWTHRWSTQGRSPKCPHVFIQTHPTSKSRISRGPVGCQLASCCIGLEPEC